MKIKMFEVANNEYCEFFKLGLTANLLSCILSITREPITFDQYKGEISKEKENYLCWNPLDDELPF